MLRVGGALQGLRVQLPVSEGGREGGSEGGRVHAELAGTVGWVAHSRTLMASSLGMLFPSKCCTRRPSSQRTCRWCRSLPFALDYIPSSILNLPLLSPPPLSLLPSALEIKAMRSRVWLRAAQNALMFATPIIIMVVSRGVERTDVLVTTPSSAHAGRWIDQLLPVALLLSFVPPACLPVPLIACPPLCPPSCCLVARLKRLPACLPACIPSCRTGLFATARASVSSLCRFIFCQATSFIIVSVLLDGPTSFYASLPEAFSQEFTPFSFLFPFLLCLPSPPPRPHGFERGARWPRVSAAPEQVPCGRGNQRSEEERGGREGGSGDQGHGWELPVVRREGEGEGGWRMGAVDWRGLRSYPFLLACVVEL